MLGIEFEEIDRFPPIHRATCTLCPKRCTGEGFCKGDALARLPCRTELRLKRIGRTLPNWKEEIGRDARRYDLL